MSLSSITETLGVARMKNFRRRSITRLQSMPCRKDRSANLWLRRCGITLPKIGVSQSTSPRGGGISESGVVNENFVPLLLSRNLRKMPHRGLPVVWLITIFLLASCGGDQGPSTTSAPSVATTAQDTVTDGEAGNRDGDRSRVTSCRGLDVPDNVEVNTSLNKQERLLEFSYYDTDSGRDRTFTIKYSSRTCKKNMETRQLIEHALAAGN